MHTKRIIPCLDVNAGRVVKGVNFVDLSFVIFFIYLMDIKYVEKI